VRQQPLCTWGVSHLRASAFAGRARSNGTEWYARRYGLRCVIPNRVLVACGFFAFIGLLAFLIFLAILASFTSCAPQGTLAIYAKRSPKSTNKSRTHKKHFLNQIQPYSSSWRTERRRIRAEFLGACWIFQRELVGWMPGSWEGLENHRCGWANRSAGESGKNSSSVSVVRFRPNWDNPGSRTWKRVSRWMRPDAQCPAIRQITVSPVSWHLVHEIRWRAQKRRFDPLYADLGTIFDAYRFIWSQEYSNESKTGRHARSRSGYL